ncbi:hypothetical protein LOAG_14112 [Loa loa]|uniref:Uncharacterized protein n=1 Tax=Loa loa TaxID=7209 RepID=A0A1S0TJ97_LOALO|nr:hypothetical protein LOAG_14112 [Loa loa]EFO14407.2 hypothetical protein LOAG_14112 [Loa loa]
MLKIKFFGGNKDKDKGYASSSLGTIGTKGMTANTYRGTMNEMKNSKLAINQNNDETRKISGLVKPKNGMTKSRKIPPTTSISSGVGRDTMKVFKN